MLKIISTGNSLKNLNQLFKTLSGIVSIYKIRNNNFFLGTAYTLYDNFNHIPTTKPIFYVKSNYIFQYLHYSYCVLWSRIAFKGKGFRIRNFQSDLKLTLNFGHSHWDRIKFFKHWCFWKIRRQSYVIVSYNNIFFHQFLLIFPHIKGINRYTKRGLRLQKQAIIRRFGKISQHISSLH